MMFLKKIAATTYISRNQELCLKKEILIFEQLKFDFSIVRHNTIPVLCH
jgi:hypothetical protein